VEEVVESDCWAWVFSMEGPEMLQIQRIVSEMVVV